MEYEFQSPALERILWCRGSKHVQLSCWDDVRLLQIKALNKVTLSYYGQEISGAKLSYLVEVWLWYHIFHGDEPFVGIDPDPSTPASINPVQSSGTESQDPEVQQTINHLQQTIIQLQKTIIHLQHPVVQRGAQSNRRANHLPNPKLPNHRTTAPQHTPPNTISRPGGFLTPKGECTPEWRSAEFVMDWDLGINETLPRAYRPRFGMGDTGYPRYHIRASSGFEGNNPGLLGYIDGPEGSYLEVLNKMVGPYLIIRRQIVVWETPVPFGVCWVCVAQPIPDRIVKGLKMSGTVDYVRNFLEEWKNKMQTGWGCAMFALWHKYVVDHIPTPSQFGYLPNAFEQLEPGV